MEEARAVIARLDRIEALELAQKPAAHLFSELELLLPEVERWLEWEGAETMPARAALERCLLALDAGSNSAPRPGDQVAPQPPARSIS